MSIKIGNNILAKSSTYHPDLLDTKWSDHILNNFSWLRADTFSWQYGNMYPKVYNHLYADLAQQGTITYFGWVNSSDAVLYTTSENPQIGDTVYRYSDNSMISFIVLDSTIEVTSLYIRIDDTETGTYTRTTTEDKILKVTQSETVANITINFFRADDGHKIVTADQVNKVNEIYQATGSAWYYVLDTQNKRFKLPRKHSQQIIHSVKKPEGSWYKLYADGWIEQGGKESIQTNTTKTINFPVKMANTDYFVSAIGCNNSRSDYSDALAGVMPNSLTSISMGINARFITTNSAGTIWWEIKGKSAVDTTLFQANEKYLYFYVGDYTQESIENIAGINTEILNGKADIESLGHIVIESLDPTTENNYTWYRKYADNWVEQGGIIETTASTISSITFPIVMADSNYYSNCHDVTQSADGFTQHIQNRTTTGMQTRSDTWAASANPYVRRLWEVKGKAA